MWDEIRSTLIELGHDGLRAAIIVVEAVLILAVAVRVGRFGRRRIEDALAQRAFGRNGAVLVGRLTSIAVLIIACLLILGLLGANWTALLAVVSAGTVAVGLALQDVLKNFVAGIYLLLERPFRVGDAIKVREVEGTIHGIDIRTTLIRNLQGELVLVPNATIFTEILTNRSEAGGSRLDLTITNVGIDLDALAPMIQDAFEANEHVKKPLLVPVLKRVEPDTVALAWSVQYDGEPRAAHCIIGTLRRLLPSATIDVESN